MQCIRCGSERTRRDGQTQLGGQRWRCNDCGRRFTARSTSAFSHHGFPDDVIAWPSAGTCATASVTPTSWSGSPSAGSWLIAARSTAGSSASCRSSRMLHERIDTPSAINGASTKRTSAFTLRGRISTGRLTRMGRCILPPYQVKPPLRHARIPEGR